MTYINGPEAGARRLNELRAFIAYEQGVIAAAESEQAVKEAKERMMGHETERDAITADLADGPVKS